MPGERLGLALALAALAYGLAPGGARADAIDGHWCAPDGRVMTIEGPAILTPGGRGAGLAFAGATGWCGMALLLKAMPWNRGALGA